MPARRQDAAPRLPAPGEQPLPSWPGETVRLGPYELFVRRAENAGAPPAVYVHGLGGSSTNWTDLMALLAGRVDGHAPDLPGFGRSGPAPDGRYGLDTHARAVVAYIRSIGGGPVHLLGNSLGGAVCVRVAAEHPDLVRSLTLVSPALPQYRLRRTSEPRLALLLIPGTSGLVERERGRTRPERVVRDVLALCMADPSRVPQARIDEAAADVERRRSLAWSTVSLTSSLRGLVRSYFEPGPRNLWRQLGRVEAPTLVVWGAHDRLVPAALAPVAVRRLRRGRLVMLPDAGHVAQMEFPEVVADAVARLFDESEGVRASA